MTAFLCFLKCLLDLHIPREVIHEILLGPPPPPILPPLIVPNIYERESMELISQILMLSSCLESPLPPPIPLPPPPPEHSFKPSHVLVKLLFPHCPNYMTSSMEPRDVYTQLVKHPNLFYQTIKM